MGELTGRTLGRYQVLEQVGRGGMATVYRANDLAQQREVALKVLSPTMAQEDLGARLQREAGMLIQLRHPHIVPVQDFGEQEGYVFLVMPYLRAGSLGDRLKREALGLETAERVVDQVCQALHYAHQRGVVHRDVKPSNILLDERGNAFLTDFGLARLHDASRSLTGSALLGTPAYISPEQARGSKVDGRSDQYSLGVVLFQLATGQLPFEADAPMALLLKHLSEPLPLPSSLNPNVPAALERVILKATAKDPAHRFGSVIELGEAFRAAVAHARNPRAPAPDIRLPPSPAAQAAGGRRSEHSQAWGYNLARLAVVAATVIAFLLACPIGSSALLTILERAASPAEGSVQAFPTARPGQATSIAATLAAIPTVTPSGRGMPMEQVGKDPAGSSKLLQGPGMTSCDAFQFGPTAVSGRNVRWALLHPRRAEASILELRIQWPAANGGLVRVYLDEDLVWQGVEETSAVILRPGPDSAGTWLDPGERTVLTFGFVNPAVATGYEVSVTLDDGCQAGGQS